MDIGGLMTKQEILKAIEDGESVWINGIEHKLDKYYFVAEYNNEPTLYLMTCGYEEDDWNNYPVETITNIYKTKAEAEHYLHHANVERVEKLPFLTWEEFKRKRELKFNSADGNYCELFIVNDFIYLQLGKEISMKQQNVGEATEENFYKAYDECVRLFRGEE